MDGFGFSDASSAVRKKRRNTSRRPRNDAQMASDYQDISSLSSTPPSDNNMMKNEDGAFGESDEASNNSSFRGSNEQRFSGADSRRSSEGVLAPANWKSTSNLGNFGDVAGNESKVKKVKLRVGGITRTINGKSASDGASAVGSSSTKSSHFPDRNQNFNKDNLDDDHSFSSGKESGLQEVGWKDCPGSGGSNVGKSARLRGRMSDENLYLKQTDTYEPNRKSKRVPKRRLLDGVLDDEEEVDDEIRFLEKVKTSKISSGSGAEYDDEEEGWSGKQRRISKVLKINSTVLHDIDDGNGSSRLGKEGKKSKSGRQSDDTDYVEEEEEEEEPGSDGVPTTKRKKARKELGDSMGESKKEMTITTRQRALQSGKNDVGSLVEFPNGLPPPPPKKQKEQLTEVEQQLKRAEALQRRRMQVEKANMESEAEAIRKILGQDSSRKKREEKMKKRKEELAQEKAVNSLILTSDHVRWIMGPSGTVVTFPDEMGLPSIFDPKPCCYPPPREKCAGPSCSNPYKYRDSKSKLPLCSLQCYKAVQEKNGPLSAC